MRAQLARLNPLALLWVGFASLLGSFAIRDLPSAVAGAVAYAVAGILVLPSWRYPLACLALCGVSSALVAYSAWRLGNADYAPVAALRILVLAWPGAVIIAFIDPSRLGDYLAQRLRVPGRFVASFVAVVQRMTDFQSAHQQISRVRRVRALGPTGLTGPVRHAGSMTFAMLASSLRGASTMSIAMDARGFATATDRTWAEPAPWSRADTAAMVIATALAAVPLAARLLT